MLKGYSLFADPGKLVEGDPGVAYEDPPKDDHQWHWRLLADMHTGQSYEEACWCRRRRGSRWQRAQEKEVSCVTGALKTLNCCLAYMSSVRSKGRRYRVIHMFLLVVGGSFGAESSVITRARLMSRGER